LEERGLSLDDFSDFLIRQEISASVSVSPDWQVEEYAFASQELRELLSIHWEGNHWMVLYDVRDSYVRVADPAAGLRRISRAEFVAKWSGYAALFDFTEAFAQAPEAQQR
jgi:ABC-type bacteriocin/lantibiotic exporter with double-glycine peptidase domain